MVSEQLGRSAGGSSTALLDLLTKVGSVADLPASVLRDLLGGEGLRGSFDQLLTPMSPDNRLSGSDLLGRAGLEMGSGAPGMLGGMAAEMLLDPLMLAGGLGMAAKAFSPKAFTGVNKSLKNWASGVGPQYQTKIEDILAEAGRPAGRRAVQGPLREMVTDPMGGMDEILTEIPEGSQIMGFVDDQTLRIKTPDGRDLTVTRGGLSDLPGVTRQPQGRVAGLGPDQSASLSGQPYSTISDMGPWQDITHEIRMPDQIEALNPLRGPDSAGNPVARALGSSPMEVQNRLNATLQNHGLMGVARDADDLGLTELGRREQDLFRNIDDFDELFLDDVDLGRQDLSDLTGELQYGNEEHGLLQQMNQELARRGQGRFRRGQTMATPSQGGVQAHRELEWDPGIVDYNQRARGAEVAPYESMALDQDLPLNWDGRKVGRPIHYRDHLPLAERGMRELNREGFPIGGDWPMNQLGELQNANQPRPEHARQLREVLMRSRASFPGRNRAAQAIPTKEEILQRYTPKLPGGGADYRREQLSQLLDNPDVPLVRQGDYDVGSPTGDLIEEITGSQPSPMAKLLMKTRTSMDQLASNIGESGLENVDLFGPHRSNPIPMIDSLLAGEQPLQFPARLRGGEIPKVPVDQYARTAIENWESLSPLQQFMLRRLGYLNPARGLPESLVSRNLDKVDDAIVPASLAAITGGATAQGLSRQRQAQPQRQGQRQY